MKSIARTVLSTVAMAAICLCIVACESSEDTSTMPAGTQPAMGALCDGCGWEKGSENCCKPGQATCACGKVKGSPGCCK